MTRDVLLFRVGDARCALPVAHVEEVVRAVAVAALPDAPRCVDGVISVRGRPVAVVNLEPCFGHASPPITPDECLVLATTADGTIAIRGRDPRLEHVPASAFHPTPSPLADTPYVAGIVELDGGIALIQRLDAVLAELASLDLGAALRDRANGIGGDP